MKVSIVGLGETGCIHYQLYRKMKNVELVALADPESCRTAAKARASGANAYSDITQMLRMVNPDLVDICSPRHLRFAHSQAALEKGCHVFAQDPEAFTPEELDTLYHIADENQVFFMTTYILPFYPEYLWLGKAIARKTYGDLLDMRFWHSGNCLLSNACYPQLDYCISQLGEPEHITRRYTGNEAGHITEYALQYENLTVQIKALGTNGSLPLSIGYEVLFSQGFAQYSHNHLAVYPHDSGLVVPFPTQAPASASRRSVSGGINIAAYKGALAYFIHCILSGEKPARSLNLKILPVN